PGRARMTGPDAGRARMTGPDAGRARMTGRDAGRARTGGLGRAGSDDAEGGQDAERDEEAADAHDPPAHGGAVLAAGVDAGVTFPRGVVQDLHTLPRLRRPATAVT